MIKKKFVQIEQKNVLIETYRKIWLFYFCKKEKEVIKRSLILLERMILGILKNAHKNDKQERERIFCLLDPIF